jgi:phosphonate utilization transcriptional regulator
MFCVPALILVMSSSPQSSPTIAQLQGSSLTNVVQRELERALLAGEYAPGSKLNEAALASSMGVSRGPVREAFRSLEEAGLLRTEKNRGVFVRAIPLDEASEIFDLRAVMEELAGRLLAQFISAEQLAELEQLVRDMDQAVASHDIDTYHNLNLRFHERLLEMSGNRKLLSLYKKLTRELTLFRRANLAQGDALPVSASEHHQIVSAIASGQPDAAAKALFQHVMTSKERTLQRHNTLAINPPH